MQQALLLERAGNLPAAVEAAREATRSEPTNWRTWLIRSRIEARAGEASAAVEAFRQARKLNPNSSSIGAARGDRRSAVSDLFHELRPYVDRGEAQGLDELAGRLQSERPVPRAGFRAELRAHLGEVERNRRAAWRPRNLGRLVAGYCGAGSLLLAVAGLGLTGTGPLGF